jgi:hypothetical protein
VIFCGFSFGVISPKGVVWCPVIDWRHGRVLRIFPIGDNLIAARGAPAPVRRTRCPRVQRTSACRRAPGTPASRLGGFSRARSDRCRCGHRHASRRERVRADEGAGPTSHLVTISPGERFPQLAHARPTEDLALSFPLIPSLVAVSFRHVALRCEKTLSAGPGERCPQGNTQIEIERHSRQLY